MSTEANTVRNYRLMFLVSVAACLLFLVFLPEWFWVTLPFIGTSFVYAMDWV